MSLLESNEEPFTTADPVRNGGEEMKLTIQITAGILLAVLIIAVARYAIVLPERMRVAAAEKAKLSNLTFAANLTPEKVIAACGQPIKDETRYGIRTMTYPKWPIGFMVDGKRPVLIIAMNDDSVIRVMLLAMPCLEKVPR